MSTNEDVGSLLTMPRSRSEGGLEPFVAELAAYIVEMKSLTQMFPDDAMAWLSSVSARVLEMVFTTLQVEGRSATKFRVEKLLPLRDELRFQFQVASRLHSVKELDFKLSGGQAT